MSTNSHLNQPGGAFRASLHPAIAGREQELRRLTDAVRRLIDAAVCHVADAETTALLAGQIAALAEALDADRLAEPPPWYHHETPEPAEPHDRFQYDVVMGLYNPVALPVELTWAPPVASGRATFTTAYEGPPGCVHGAVIAGAFDQVFNVANLAEGVAGPTRRLEISYERPTLLHQPLVLEAHVERVEGRRVTTMGQIIQGEQVTARGGGVRPTQP